MKQTKQLTIGLIICCLTATVGLRPALAAEKVPHKAHIILKEVSELIGNKKYQEAVHRLISFQDRAPAKSRRSVNEGNHHYLVTFALGNAYLYLDQPESAVDKYRLVLENRPRFFPAWSNLGKAHFQMQQFEKAAQTFFKAYDLSNNREFRLLHLSAVSFLNAELPEKALESLQLFIGNHPGEYGSSQKETFVRVLFALNRVKEALPVIRNIILETEGAQKKRWQEVLLYQYIEQQMHKPALALSRKLAGDDPLEPKWWKGLAHLHLLADRQEKSLAAMMIVARLRPLSAEEKKLLASLNLSLNIPLQSVRYYQDIMQTKMTPDMVKSLVHAYLKLDDVESAQKWIDSGLAHFEDDELLLLKANLHFEEHQFDAAAGTYEKLVARKPDQGQTWLMWGYATWKLGKTVTARWVLTLAATFSEQKDSALAILKQMNQFDQSGQHE